MESLGETGLPDPPVLYGYHPGSHSDFPSNTPPSDTFQTPRAAPFFTDRVTDRRYKGNPPGRSVGPPGATSTGYQLLPEKASRSVK